MSLINDALKRAKEAQQQKPASTPGGPPLRPVEPRPGSGSNLWLMLIFAVVVAVGAILVWQWHLQSRRTKLVTNSSPPAASNQLVPGPTQVVALASQPAPATPPTNEAVKVAATMTPAVARTQPISTNVSPVAQLATNPPPTVDGTTNGPTVDAVAVAPPQPPPLKLQGVFFHPTRPSVVVNGKLLFVGDRMGEWRVIAIDPQSVTLAGSGKTNVLLLE